MYIVSCTDAPWSRSSLSLATFCKACASKQRNESAMPTGWKSGSTARSPSPKSAAETIIRPAATICNEWKRRRSQHTDSAITGSSFMLLSTVPVA